MLYCNKARLETTFVITTDFQKLQLEIRRVTYRKHYKTVSADLRRGSIISCKLNEIKYHKFHSHWMGILVNK